MTEIDVLAGSGEHRRRPQPRDFVRPDGSYTDRPLRTMAPRFSSIPRDSVTHLVRDRGRGARIARREQDASPDEPRSPVGIGRERHTLGHSRAISSRSCARSVRGRPCAAPNRSFRTASPKAVTAFDLARDHQPKNSHTTARRPQPCARIQAAFSTTFSQPSVLFRNMSKPSAALLSGSRCVMTKLGSMSPCSIRARSGFM